MIQHHPFVHPFANLCQRSGDVANHAVPHGGAVSRTNGGLRDGHLEGDYGANAFFTLHIDRAKM